MTCPKCKRARLRQHVSIYVECDADCRSLNKKGIRSPDVQVKGAGWPTALLFCPKCGWALKLKDESTKK